MNTQPPVERRTERCQVCQHLFIYTPKADEPPRTLCGFLACHARANWGPDDWAGRARMATARKAAGVPLDALDDEALSRMRAGAA